MDDVFKGIVTADGKKRQLPYANVLETPVSDKTLSEDGGFADAKVTGDNFAKAKAETDSLKGDLVPFIYPHQTATSLDLVPIHIPNGAKVRMELLGTGATETRIVFYNAQQTRLDYWGLSTTKGLVRDIVTTFGDAEYISLWTGFANEPVKVTYYNDDVVISQVKNLSGYIPRFTTELELGNYYNINTITKGQYKDYSSGTIRSNGSYSYSDYISILPNNKYFINTSNVHVCFYDANKVYVSGVVASNQSITTPKNALYMVASVAIVDTSSCMVTHSENAPSGYMKYPSLMLNGALVGVDSVSYDKKVAFLGDSITQGVSLTNVSERYSTQFCSLMGCTELNYGQSGTRVSKSDDYMPTKSFIERYTSIANDADIIVIFGGTNDYYGGATLGTFGSTNDYDFYGALNNLVSGIKANYPNKDIILITPMKSYHNHDTDFNNGQGTMEDYVNAIISIANKYSVPVVDLFHNCNIDGSHDTNNRTYYFCNDDGSYLHPNGIGHSRIANMLKKAFEFYNIV